MIKLDRAFVMGLPEDERDCALADLLSQMTDRFGQGYLIFKPRPFDELLDRLGAKHAA